MAGSKWNNLLPIKSRYNASEISNNSPLEWPGKYTLAEMSNYKEFMKANSGSRDSLSVCQMKQFDFSNSTMELLSVWKIGQRLKRMLLVEKSILIA